MIVRVLGSAAGGGVPQWNCSCANCGAARAGTAPRRTQSSLAVSSDGRRWLLLNCSPDVATQIEAFAPLHPAAGRVTPISDVFLTDANLDHIGGLAILRQATQPLRIWSSRVVREIAAAQPSFAQFAAAPHVWFDVPLDDESPIRDGGGLDAGLEVRAICVPGTTPGYDGRRVVNGSIVAYELLNRGSERRLLFAPVFAAIGETLRAAIARAAVAFLDGSFYTEEELQGANPGGRRARAMGHQPVGGPGGTLEQLGTVKARVYFTHVNNTNPMLDTGSQAFREVRARGAEIAYDGMELTL